MKKRWLTLFFLVLLSAFAFAAKSIFVPPVPENINMGITSADEAHEPHKGFGFVEMWSFLARSENGLVANCQFGVSNAGISNNFPAYNITVILPDQKIVNIFSEFKSKDLKADKNNFSVEFPNVKLFGRHPNYYLKLKDPEIKMDMVFKAGSPGVKLSDDGRVKFGKNFKGFYKEILMAPTATVSGTIEVKGAKHNINGWGYVEHALSNTFPPSFVKRWNSLRFHSEKLTVIHSGFVPDSDYNERYFGITTIVKDGRVKHISTAGRLELLETILDPVSKYAIPRKGVITVNDPGCTLSMEIQFDDFIERIETLAKVNIITRKLVEIIYARPYIYRYPPIDTTVKVDFGQGLEPFSGEVISQIVFFK